jgi:hypothetical protein
MSDLTESSLSDSENESSSLSEVSEYIIPNGYGHEILFDKPSPDAGVVSVQMATDCDIDTFGSDGHHLSEDLENL